MNKKPLTAIFFLLFSSAAFSQPFLSESQAYQAIRHKFLTTSLYWKPTQLPLTLVSTDKTELADLLADLYQAGALIRQSQVRFEKTPYGKRKRVVIDWTYDWLNTEQAGIVYGKRQLASIMSVSPVSYQDGAWYGVVNVQWYVVNTPHWLSDEAFADIRLVRRSLESSYKPFEAGLILQYQPESENWALLDLP